MERRCRRTEEMSGRDRRHLSCGDNASLQSISMVTRREIEQCPVLSFDFD